MFLARRIYVSHAVDTVGKAKTAANVWTALFLQDASDREDCLVTLFNRILAAVLVFSSQRHFQGGRS